MAAPAAIKPFCPLAAAEKTVDAFKQLSLN
jgi:hypothetical protein